MTQKKLIHYHFALEVDLAMNFDALAEEWGVKRPVVLLRLVEPEYKKMMRKRAQAFPDVSYRTTD